MKKNITKDNWKTPREINHIVQKKFKYYIFCEGEQTEPLYFIGMKNLIEKNALYKNSVFINVEGVGANTVYILDRAQEYVKENNISNAQIWIIYDKDSFPDEDFNMVSQISSNLNKKRNDISYNVAWSNQCVEYWFILHFDYYTSDNDRKYYISYLNKKFGMLKLGNYKKNDIKIFEKLMLYGDSDKAIRFAEKRLLEEEYKKNDSKKAPATMVHQIFKELSQYFPKDYMNFIKLH